MATNMHDESGKTTPATQATKAGAAIEQMRRDWEDAAAKIAAFTKAEKARK
jgi:hypothetical protein